MFMNRFSSFAEGLSALFAASFSVKDIFGQNCDVKPKVDFTEGGVRSWLGGCAEYRGTGNGVDWNIEYYGNPFGVAYRTKSGLVFGWRYFPDTFGDNADEPVFFVDRPGKKETPEGGSSLYNSLEAAGWNRVNPDGNPYYEGKLVEMAQKVGWQPAEVLAEV
jgi:hypothetical protein